MSRSAASARFFEPVQGWWLHHCPGQPAPMPDHSFSKEIFPNVQSKPPLMQLEAHLRKWWLHVNSPQWAYFGVEEEYHEPKLLRFLCDYMKNVLSEHRTAGDCSLYCRHWTLSKRALMEDPKVRAEGRMFYCTCFMGGCRKPKWFSPGSKASPQESPKLQVLRCIQERLTGIFLVVKELQIRGTAPHHSGHPSETMITCIACS